MRQYRRCGFVAALAFAVVVLAGDRLVGAPALAAGEQEAKAAGDEAAKKEAEEKPEFPPFEAVTKGFTQVDSADPTEEKTFLPLWYKEKEDTLLAEIPKGLLGADFLMATSVSGGSQFTGFQWGTRMVHWERMGKKLLLVQPDVRYEEAAESTLSDVIKRSFTARIISTVDILTESPAGDPLVDLGAVFKSDMLGWSRLFGGTVHPGLSKWGKFKAFPKNVELPVETAMSEQGPGATATRVLLHYSLSELPKTEYKPRRADERIGYFMTATMDWGKKHDAATLFNRYVERWNLQKVDPSLKLSPVKEPIVWYIEKTVPIRWRQYVKEGILEWNKAFEKCGFLDAVQVRQQTDTEFANLDPEDVRYNFFRWIVTGQPFAAGPSRAHPRTGQIFDADIVMDDSFLRVMVEDTEAYAANSMVGDYDALLDEFLEAHPQWRAPSFRERLLPISSHSLRHGLVPEPSGKELEARFAEQMFREGRFCCAFARSMAEELAFASAAAEAEGEEGLSDEVLGSMVKEVATHEVGHCLGLTHNFKASTWLDLDEIVNGKSAPNRATVGSIMDYSPIVFKLKGEAHTPQFVTNTIGPYDYWAIEYGYKPVEEPFKSEDELLKSITGRAGEEGLQFASDLDAFFFSPDPYVNRHDMGKDPLDFVSYRMEQARRLIKDMQDWAVDDGESYAKLRRTLFRILRQYNRAVEFAARFVGGMELNYTYKGDPNEQPAMKVVDLAKQREALKLVCDKVFADGTLEFSPKLLNRMAPGRFAHWGSDQFDLFVQYPVHEIIRQIQYQALFTMLNPFTLNRIYGQELQLEDGTKTMTIAELFETLTDSIWSELDKEDEQGKPAISSFRRGLQRSYLQLMIEIVLRDADALGIPSDVRSVAFVTLEDLANKIGDKMEADGKGLDVFSRAHLRESKLRIDKALDAHFVAN
ncbi:MAG: zinc-dependent metalloprotease [Phycisphaerales bacterium]|nr:MAG: zinc-dependent metalloprotease [Phycisphaerales bacterium]